MARQFYTLKMLKVDSPSDINWTVDREYVVNRLDNNDWLISYDGTNGTVVGNGTVAPIGMVWAEQANWTASDNTKLDFIKNKPTIPFSSPSYTNNPSVTIQTVAAAANGNQLSSTRHAIVNYSVTVQSATQIGVVSNVSGYVVLEICPTNSSTAGDWIEIGRSGNGQNIGLAVALSITTTSPSQVGGVVPAGYFRRLRSVNTAGTPTYTYNTGQEVLI